MPASPRWRDRRQKFDDADKALAQAKQLIPNDPLIATLQQEIAAGRKAMAANVEAAKLQAIRSVRRGRRVALNAKKYAEAVQHLTPRSKSSRPNGSDHADSGPEWARGRGTASQELMAYNDAMKAA
jgi:hypothetical protein